MDVSDRKALATDEIRMRNQRAMAEQRHEIEIRELKERQNEELQNLINDHSYRTEKMKQAYDVEISEEGERLEQRLQKVRDSGESRIEAEKAAKDLELARVKSTYQQRLEEYRKHGEQQLDKVRQDVQQATQRLQEQARTAERSRAARSE